MSDDDLRARLLNRPVTTVGEVVDIILAFRSQRRASDLSDWEIDVLARRVLPPEAA